MKHWLSRIEMAVIAVMIVTGIATGLFNAARAIWGWLVQL